MFINNKNTTVVSFLGALALGLGGCISSGGSGSTNGGGDDSEEGLDLSEVSLADTDGLVPFRGVEIEGLPDGASAENLHVHYRIKGESISLRADSDEAVLAPVASFRDGPMELLVPLAKADGATIEMRITDGINDSEVITASIGALASRQNGAWDDYVSGLRDLVETTAEAYGLDYPSDIETWWNNPGHTEVPYVSLVLAYNLLEVDGEEPALKDVTFDEQELELIERIIPHMGLVSEMDRFENFAGEDPESLIADSLSELGTQTLPTVAELASASSQAQMAAQIQQQGAVPQSLNDNVSFEDGSAYIDGLFDIDGPDEVQDWMNRYNAAWHTQQAADAAFKAADYTLTAATVAAVVASGGSGTGAAIAGRTATRAAMKKMISAGQATAGVTRLGLGLIPCCMHDVDAELLPEDGTAEIEDGTSSIVRVERLTARMQNDGTDFAKEFLERFPLNKVGGDISGEIAKQGTSSFANEVVVDAGFREVFGQFDVDLFDVNFVWEGVDISGTQASVPPGVDGEAAIDWELDGFAGEPPTFEHFHPDNFSFPYGDVLFRYDPETFFDREGDLNLLYTRPSEEFYTFGVWHPPIPEDRSELRGVPIRVVFDPARLRVDDPGEEIEFSVEVRNAEDATLVDDGELETTPDLSEPENQEDLGWIEGPLDGPDPEQGRYDYRYHAPEDDLNDFETILVETEADSNQGVREEINDPAPREGSMFIRTDAVEVAVSPQQVCLDEGETETFEATDALTGDEVDVTWEAEHGSISSNGTFTSPGASVAIGLTSEVTATLESDPDVTGTASVTMECSCWYDAEVSGDIGQSYGAASMWVDFDEDSEAIESIQLSNDLEDSGPAGLELVFDPPVPAGATGDFDARTPQGTFRTTLDFGSVDPTNPFSVPGIWQNVPYGDDPWDPIGLLSLQENNIYPLSDQSVPPMTVTFDRHDMWDDTPDGSELLGGERSLALRVTGNVRRLGLESINDDEAQVVIMESGPIEIDVEGEFWPGAVGVTWPSDRQYCSPVL
ncbi:Ig-like domain-containing protein [Aquisalimonas sp. 2447]|uniref:Ig-like domain-containing protein n=1 Tax=Aquisalimonas sp. 2447 TaxID=2740807 RepID=UPI0014326B2B|nr:Ig-like domain-containing protein [Aquisalimonas sp. 2447]QIT56967.1 Ig-like domain-containing protein [Aquisalimonas sp. 2447]